MSAYPLLSVEELYARALSTDERLHVLSLAKQALIHREEFDAAAALRALEKPLQAEARTLSDSFSALGKDLFKPKEEPPK